MATKNNPGAFDCYADAAPDEPIFVLRANDELAPEIVRLWAMIRSRAPIGVIQNCVTHAMAQVAAKEPMNIAKFSEAMKCADDMEKWKGDRSARERSLIRQQCNGRDFPGVGECTYPNCGCITIPAEVRAMKNV